MKTCKNFYYPELTVKITFFFEKNNIKNKKTGDNQNHLRKKKYDFVNDGKHQLSALITG